ncbi:hypothetical protein NPIL_448661 [Nephila pilipes]|uniref:Uncharacterized protein n=1 Tax=Nephila pilipes TaxID=299642 RepID=A0A8X6MGA6_NEPPI|nr:hypothetical protein NPIL_448661 [Nephila pilipes]
MLVTSPSVHNPTPNGLAPRAPSVIALPVIGLCLSTNIPGTEDICRTIWGLLLGTPPPRGEIPPLPPAQSCPLINLIQFPTFICNLNGVYLINFLMNPLKVPPSKFFPKVCGRRF